MRAHPERTRPLIKADLSRIEALTAGVAVHDDDAIPNDVTL